MRLLLDEMISPAIARQLRDRGLEVEAVKRDRPELEAVPDREIVQRMTAERRAVVTNDIADFLLTQPRPLSRLRRSTGASSSLTRLGCATSSPASRQAASASSSHRKTRTSSEWSRLAAAPAAEGTLQQLLAGICPGGCPRRRGGLGPMNVNPATSGWAA